MIGLAVGCLVLMNASMHLLVSLSGSCQCGSLPVRLTQHGQVRPASTVFGCLSRVREVQCLRRPTGSCHVRMIHDIREL